MFKLCKVLPMFRPMAVKATACQLLQFALSAASIQSALEFIIFQIVFYNLFKYLYFISSLMCFVLTNITVTIYSNKYNKTLRLIFIKFRAPTTKDNK